jgi:small multidrug resistance pump
MAWLLLAGAITAEVAATLALRGTANGLRPLAVAFAIGGYTAALVMMTIALRTLKVGVVYAIWSGVGTAGVVTAAAMIYHERLNLAAFGGILLIIIGVIVLTASGATHHG